MSEAMEGAARGRGRGRPAAAGLGALGDSGITGRNDREADDIRPPVRSTFDLSPELAKARARELREAGVLAEEASGAFDLPPAMIRQYEEAGWSLEWKAETVAGKENRNHMNDAARRGWEPVPPERHPDVIVRKEGLILMCRPAEITREAFAMNQVKARAQVENKELQLTTGENLDQNTVDDRRKPGRIKRSVERIPD